MDILWGSGWVRRNFFFSAEKVTSKKWVLLLMAAVLTAAGCKVDLFRLHCVQTLRLRAMILYYYRARHPFLVHKDPTEFLN